MNKLILDVNIGHNLKRARVAKSMSQQQVVEKMELHGSEMSRSTLSHVENGISNISVQDLVILKEVLGVSYEDIFASTRRSK